MDYKFSINDYKYFSYHRNSGITKLGIRDPETTSEEMKKHSNGTEYMIRSVEAAVLVMDRIN